VSKELARCRVYAKVNLWLRVLGRRADGYHAIETLFHGIGLADEIQVSINASGRVDVEMISMGQDTGAPALEENLAYRAARSFLDETGRRDGVAVQVRKEIPMSAGLGGGSADAAGVLELMSTLFGTTPRDTLRSVASKLGSDVPYFLVGGTVWGSGRGEQLVRVQKPPTLWFVLGLTKKGLSTADVYSAWDRLPQSTPPTSRIHVAHDATDPADIARALHNDLELAATTLRPELAHQKERMLEAGALGACVSGSGPTLLGVARDRDHAMAAAAQLEGVFDRVVVTRSVPSSVERL